MDYITVCHLTIPLKNRQYPRFVSNRSANLREFRGKSGLNKALTYTVTTKISFSDYNGRSDWWLPW